MEKKWIALRSIKSYPIPWNTNRKCLRFKRQNVKHQQNIKYNPIMNTNSPINIAFPVLAKNILFMVPMRLSNIVNHRFDLQFEIQFLFFLAMNKSKRIYFSCNVIDRYCWKLIINYYALWNLYSFSFWIIYTACSLRWTPFLGWKSFHRAFIKWKKRKKKRK